MAGQTQLSDEERFVLAAIPYLAKVKPYVKADGTRPNGDAPIIHTGASGFSAAFRAHFGHNAGQLLVDMTARGLIESRTVKGGALLALPGHLQNRPLPKGEGSQAAALAAQIAAKMAPAQTKAGKEVTHQVKVAAQRAPVSGGPADQTVTNQVRTLVPGDPGYAEALKAIKDAEAKNAVQSHHA